MASRTLRTSRSVLQLLLVLVHAHAHVGKDAWRLGQLTDSVACVPQFIKADIQSADLISHVLQTEEIDTIMHFAAQVRVSWAFSWCPQVT